jgi:hypothetical protein
MADSATKDQREEMSDEAILEQLQSYVNAGALEYVLPTTPLGEAWVVGFQGQILKFNTKDEIMALLFGANMVLRGLMDKYGLRL